MTRTTPARIDAAERRRHALQLRRDGLGFDAIAATLDVAGKRLYSSKQAAHRAVQAELRAITREAAEDLRSLELARLDDLHRHLWPETAAAHVVACPNCEHELFRMPNLAAVNMVLKVMERRSRFLGLDAADVNEARALALLEDQVAMTYRAIRTALDRAGLDDATQKEVVDFLGSALRDEEEAARG